MQLSELKTGDRVKIHPANDVWMRGARFGVVTKVGRKYVHEKWITTWQGNLSGSRRTISRS